MYLISSGTARLTAEILRYIQETYGAFPELVSGRNLRCLCCVGRRGLGDPSDRAAETAEGMS